MPTTFNAKILVKTGNRTALASTPPAIRQPFRESDSGRFGTGTVVAATAGWIADPAISAAGDTTLALTSYKGSAKAVITVGAGAGVYVANLVLPESVLGIDGVTACVPQAGDEVRLRIAVAASVNPTLHIFRNNKGTTALATLTGDATTARTYLVELVYSGAAWVLFDLRQFNP